MVTYTFLAFFLCLMGYVTYFEFALSEQFINNPYNKRQELFTQKVIRGEIYSADGVTLAETIVDAEENEVRRYPCARIFSHIVGYSGHGTAGLEATANFSLLRSNIFYGEKVVSDLQGEKSPGDSVYTTLNYELQLQAFDALGHYDGAVVVLEPQTGRLLAMVSKPDFDPNTIGEDWEELVDEDNDRSELLNRATQGRYPPGSTFKIFTTLEYLREHPEDYTDYRFSCSGEYTEGHKTIHCYNNARHGSEDLKEAFANSCNSAYSSIGLELDLAQFHAMCESMLFDTDLPVAIESSKSSFVLEEGADTSAVMETAIGQGQTLVTPLHVALITGAIANDGVLMSPYVIDHVSDDRGVLVEQYTGKEYGRLMSSEEAAVLKEYMGYVIEAGTGRQLSNDRYEVYGKTGSAEFSTSSKASHSWFTGFAHQDGKPDIVVTVIVEDSGVGSEYAVPIAQEIFDAYYIE